MKRLIIIIIVLSSCSSDDNNSKKTYEDLTGDWVFSDGTISGEVNIIKLGDDYASAEGTEFIIDGNTYINTFDSGINLSSEPFEIGGFTVMTDGANAYVEFYNGVFNSTYTEITYDSYSWGDGCPSACEFGNSDENIMLTRK